MIGLLKRFLHIPKEIEPDNQVVETKVKLAELQESQARLRDAVENTGFFLGDALHIRDRADNDRARTSHHGN